MNKLSEQESTNFSISDGDDLPSFVLTSSLPKILVRAASYGTGIAIKNGQKTANFFSYENLLQDAQKILNSLRQRNLQPQDQVILQLQEPRYFFAGLWGCFLGGFVPIPLGVDLHRNHSKLNQIAELCDFPLIITDIDIKLDLQDVLKDLAKDLAIFRVEDLLQGEPDGNCHMGQLDDLALLIFTSGSTGKPKGVMLSVRNLLASTFGMAKVNNLSQRDITLNWMPLEHVASLVMFHLTEVYLGCQQIQVKSELILQNPLRWLDWINQYRVTATWSPNFAYNLVNEKLEDQDQYDIHDNHDWDLSCLRWMGNGAEAVVGKTTKRFLELLTPYGLVPNVVSPGYGMSETCAGIAHAHGFYQNEYLDKNQEFVSVGAPIPGVSLRVVNEEHQIVPEGEIGLLQVKGETVTAGYYRQPELNQEIFTPDGWFNTGDLSFLTAGKLTITGRQKEVIIINGVNYYSHDIEAVVEAIANISISYTAACGVKDSNHQEQIAIFLHTDNQADQLRELINTVRKHIFTAIGVTPAYIIPVAQETIPKTAIGKIRRSQLSQRFAAGEFSQKITEIAELFDQRNLSPQDLPSNAIEQILVKTWQEVLNLATVGVQDNFFELGGNSLLLMQVLNVLSKQAPEYIHLSAVTLFQYPTISALGNYLNLNSDQESGAVKQGKDRGEIRRRASGNKDVAIIGMSCRFPGANNIHEFWDNLCHGVESISFFADQEILDSGVDQELLKNPNYVKASPILENIEDFDAEFWGYSPKEAQLLDPQQRLFMECAWTCLEDAGYDPLTYQGEISLYGGAATNTYLLNNIYPNRHSIDEQDDLQVINLSSMGGFQVTTANDKDYLTTRTSYKLNLRGLSVNVQTACSTSLVTVHLASQSLINSECDIALAGGVSVHSPQKMGYLYQEGMILSPDGHCRAFDAEAGGTIFGSGAGMVVLKLLDKAVEDGDRIYGVIKGSAVNNDGGAKVGYFAPNVDGQTRVVAEALAYADIPLQSVSYIEAHGTGTKLGDPIEIKALTQAYRQSGSGLTPTENRSNQLGKKEPRKQHCAIGSVKTNVGHLQMASGIVGLIKTTLCLYHQKIVPSLHFSNPNPQIDFDQSPFYVNTQLQDWKIDLYPRRAGVNSLGIGGTNAHLILEEFTVAQKVNQQEINHQELPAYLLTLSAKTETALQELVKNYQNFLGDLREKSLQDICLTSNIGRHHFDYRLAIVASSQSTLVEQLSQVSTGNLGNQIQKNSKIVWLFTGQGSQYKGMARELYDVNPVFRENCDRCWEILNNNPVGAFRGMPLREMPLREIDLNQTQYAQPLLFTIEYSLAQLWLAWGIKPDVLMGHSIGEYVAATIAGVFSFEDALKLVVTRGKLMQNLPDNGAMLAVFTREDQILDLLDQNINIAAYNGSHVVLSGLREDINDIAKKLESQEVKTQLLNLGHAFHSPLMRPMVEEFKMVADTIKYSPPNIPIVSNLTGKLADNSIAAADYWVDHILRPVQFAKSIEYLEQQQLNIFLEIGTKPTLIGMAQSILVLNKNQNNKLFLPSLNSEQNDWQQILETLSQLYLAGVEINWSQVAANYNGQKISLPTYPFQRQRHWFDIPTEVIPPQPLKTNLIHPLLGQYIPSPLKQTIFQSDFQLDTITWLQDHCIDNQVIFPGMAYLEMAIASGIFHFQTNQLTIKNLAIDSPLYIQEDSLPEIQLILSPKVDNADNATWEIYSLDHGQWQLHSRGQVSHLNQTTEKIQLKSIQAQFQNSDTNSELEVNQHYQQCQQRGINYGDHFRGIKQLWAKDNQALGLIELPDNLDRNLGSNLESGKYQKSEYNFHPALLDSCLQILFAALPVELSNQTYIPVGVDQFDLHSLPQNKVWSYLELRSGQSQPKNQNKILSADVWIYSDRGDLIAKLTGLKSQAMNSQPSWHNWLYQQQWIKQSLSGESSLSTHSNLSNQTGTWLIFVDNTGLGNKLIRLLEAERQQCTVILLGNIADSPEAFQNLIQQQKNILGVIYLWSLEEVEDWQECKNFLYLVQALINNQEHPPLWFITRNAQPVDSYQLTSGIRQSCLWGMHKAIALEYPELSCVGIDLELNSDSTSTNDKANEAENIFQEICAIANIVVSKETNVVAIANIVVSKETNVVTSKHVGYRNNQRHVARLVRANLNEPNLHLPNQPNLNSNLQLQIGRAGNLDSLRWEAVPRKQPQKNEIEIEVKATGLNFRDVMVALDLYPDDAGFLGLECAGVVTAIGQNVTDFQIGDQVIAIADQSFSQYLTVNSLLVVPKPKSFSHEEAATIPVTFLTAYYTLIYMARLQPGEKVLIHAAAGGVGLAAIQIAQSIGAEVFATASPPKWKFLRSLGVTHIMNSRNLDFAKDIMTATDGKGVDMVLNSLSGEFIPKSISVLNNRGRFIEIGKQGIWSQQEAIALKPNIDYSIVDLWQITQDNPTLIQQMLRELLPQFTARKLKPLTYTVFSSDKTLDAFRYMQQGKHQGKIVITQENILHQDSHHTSYKSQGEQPFAPTGTYLITGGLGAIGILVAEWLVSKGIKNLVLLGRSDVQPKLQGKLQKLQEETQVDLVQADVADQSQLAEALATIEQTSPPLRGVIHCAGLTSDRPISQQDWISFSQVLAPKVHGAWNLHSLTQKYDLESFILFSSASSLIGSAGQSNYSAANAFLDALAHGRRRQGLPAIAINWSPWQDTGLASNPQITENLKRKGVGSLKSNEAIEILEQLLVSLPARVSTQIPAQIGVIPIDWNTWGINHTFNSFYENFLSNQPKSITQLDSKQEFLSIETPQRRALLIEQVSQLVGSILGIKGINQIDLELGFSELGLDSLSSVELRNKIQSSYDLKLSATAIFDYSNVKQLADYLLSLLFKTEPATESSPTNTIKKSEESVDLSGLEDLSEIEAEALLLEELGKFDLST